MGTPLVPVFNVNAPDKVKAVRVPTLVIFGCADVFRVNAVFPLTVKLVRVPTDVILGCAAVVSVIAVADSDAGTVVSAIYYSFML